MNRKSLIFLATGALAAAAITGTALASDTGTATARTGSAAIAADTTPSATTAAQGATPVDNGTPVDADRAGEIALARIGGGMVVETEREVEHGRSVWSVKIAKDGVRHKVYVDAQTGQVVRVEPDGVDDHGQGRDDRSGGDNGGDDKGGDDHGQYDG